MGAAHTLSELERSFDRVGGELLVEFTDATDPERILECLHSIGEELRHITWHLNDSRYYSYLRPTDPKP